MSDPELVLDILSSILIAVERIERRFQGIEEPADFVVNDEGIDRLDGIAMMLIAIGEQVKRLDGVTEENLDDAYPEIDWKGVKGIRDVLSHHYFSADAEIIFDVCQNKIRDLKRVVLLIETHYSNE
jgi:uncharacterized protein with HEPN domain